jgi:hypothetical protein
MPITTASRKGISAVAAAACKERVLLTSQGRPVAVVDSAERIDESLREVRQAAGAVLDWAASLVSERSERMTLDQVCSRLDLDADRIRDLAQQRLTSPSV